MASRLRASLVDPLERSPRIKFTEPGLPLHRLDSAAVDNNTIDRLEDGETLVRQTTRSRAMSISHNIDLKDALTEPGREPGVDVNNLELDIHHQCQITVTDYCKSRYHIHGPFGNDAFLQFMDLPKPEWSKIRWINVNGMSFDIIKRLSNTYALHQLSVEDALHFPTRTKIDHYAEHSYVCLALLLLIEEDKIDSDARSENMNVSRKLTRWAQSERQMNKNVTHVYRESDFQTTLREYHFPKSTYNRSVLQYGHTNSEVGIEQVSLFYTKDGIVISMFEHSAELITRPILKRIAAGSAMLLRSTEDIDLLVHALVDGIVDNCEQVISGFQEHLATLERGVLDNPKREHTRELHLFISDLSLLKKTLAPVITIVNDFRNNLQNAMVAKAQLQNPVFAARTRFGENAYEPNEVNSFTNNRSGYWADVADHSMRSNVLPADLLVHANTDNIDSMRALSDNLINLIFNTLSSRQNDIMRSLTITTIVFLPLTFLTGYFGKCF